MRLLVHLRDRLLVVAYVVLAALPVFAMLTGWQGRVLWGALPPTPRPVLAYDDVLTEKYQHALVAWFESNFGLKGTLIALDNMLLFRVFAETKFGSPVRVGKDGVLFVDDDINHHSRHGAQVPPPAYFERVAQRVAAAQRTLSGRRTALVPVIIPSKTSIWPEKVSAAWDIHRGRAPESEAVYREMKAALVRHGVQFVDAREMMERAIASGAHAREDLFGRDARHWSDWAACLAFREVTERYAGLSGRPRPAHECELTHRRGNRRVDPSYDLWRLLNALSVPPQRYIVPIVKHATPNWPLAEAPSVLFVGTSFCWEMVHDVHRSQLFGKVWLNYYNQSVHPRFDELPAFPTTPMTDAWREVMLGRDLIVLDLFEGYATPGSYVDLFLDQLEPELAAAAPVTPAR